MRRNISIPQDINDYLNKLTNASSYIVQLIRQDIKDSQTLGKDEIIKIIREYIADKAVADDIQADESINSFLNM